MKNNWFFKSIMLITVMMVILIPASSSQSLFGSIAPESAVPVLYIDQTQPALPSSGSGGGGGSSKNGYVEPIFQTVGIALDKSPYNIWMDVNNNISEESASLYAAGRIMQGVLDDDSGTRFYNFETANLSFDEIDYNSDYDFRISGQLRFTMDHVLNKLLNPYDVRINVELDDENRGSLSIGVDNYIFWEHDPATDTWKETVTDDLYVNMNGHFDNVRIVDVDMDVDKYFRQWKEPNGQYAASVNVWAYGVYIPEPTTTGLLSLGCLLLFRRRR